MGINFTDQELLQLKTIYCLWWHYLQQSFWYRKFCEIMHKSGIEANVNTRELFDKAEDILESIYASENKNESQLTEPPNRLVLNSYWDFFGNVHENDFEKWWKQKKDSLAKDFIIDLRDPNAVESLFIFEAATRRFCKDHPNSFPTAETMLSLVTRDKEYIYIAIPLWNLTIREIGKQINKIRKKQKKEWPYERNRLRGINIIIHGRKELDELQRYLDYFILKTNGELTEDEMIKKREKEEIEKDEDSCKSRDEIQRIISADKQRAEKIIRNVEEGIFPGSYQPDDQ